MPQLGNVVPSSLRGAGLFLLQNGFTKSTLHQIHSPAHQSCWNLHNGHQMCSIFWWIFVECTLKICTKCTRWCNPTKPTNFCCWIVLILSKVDKSFTNELDNQNCHPYHMDHMVKIGTIASVWCKSAKNSRRWRHSSCTIANLSAAAGQIVPQLIAQPNLFSF